MGTGVGCRFLLQWTDHGLSALFTVTRPSWVALNDRAQSFPELHKPLHSKSWSKHLFVLLISALNALLADTAKGRNLLVSLVGSNTLLNNFCFEARFL